MHAHSNTQANCNLFIQASNWTTSRQHIQHPHKHLCSSSQVQQISSNILKIQLNQTKHKTWKEQVQKYFKHVAFEVVRNVLYTLFYSSFKSYMKLCALFMETSWSLFINWKLFFILHLTLGILHITNSHKQDNTKRYHKTKRFEEREMFL